MRSLALLRLSVASTVDHERSDARGPCPAGLMLVANADPSGPRVQAWRAEPVSASPDCRLFEQCVMPVADGHAACSVHGGTTSRVESALDVVVDR
jgi:hypothetical protein